MSRLDQLPVLESRAAQVAAARYNQVRLALKRVGDPLRLPLPGLRHLQLELSRDAWSCIDTSLNDLPVFAWTDFGPRRSLHQPIDCSLRLYHQHATLILARVEEAMEVQLAERLAGAGPS